MAPLHQGSYTPSIKVCITVDTFQVPSHVKLHSDITAMHYFLYGMGYKKFDISLTDERLEAAMYAEMYEWKIQCHQLQKTLHLAASLIDVCQLIG